MRTFHHYNAAFVFLSLALAVHGAEREDLKTDWSLKPSMLHGSADNELAPALKFDGSLRYNLAIAPRDDLALTLQSRGAVATKSSANSENLFAAFLFGYAHDFYDWTSSGPVPEAGQRRGRPLPTIEQKPFSALVEFSFKTRFETDQQFNNYNVTFGPQLGFTPKHQQGWFYLLPSCYVDYQRVEMLQSQSYEQLGIPESAFWRLDASAGWLYPIGSELARDIPWLRPVDLQFDFHYYQSFNLPAGAQQASLDEATYYAGTIGYNLRSINPDHPSAFARYVPYVYVSVGYGRLPPATVKQTMVFVGIVYGKGH